MNDIDLDIITRLEIIDENGRAYTRWNVNIMPSIQDDGRTLKLFVSPRTVDFVAGKPKC